MERGGAPRGSFLLVHLLSTSGRGQSSRVLFWGGEGGVVCVCVIFELSSQRDPKDLESLQFPWPIIGYTRDLSSSEVS